MNLQQMVNAINELVDDVVTTSNAVRWLNEAKDDMGIDVGAKFPDLIETEINSTFVFDSQYHTIPILFAAMRFKEKDSALQEAMNFRQQYEDRKRDFVLKYEVPPRYLDGRSVQQFIASAGQDTFTITKNSYHPASGELRVYVNDIEVPVAGIGYMPKTFVLATPCAEGDAVTATWEEHPDLYEPPYPWWRW